MSSVCCFALIAVISSVSFRVAASACFSCSSILVSRSSNFEIMFWCVVLLVVVICSMCVRRSVIYVELACWVVSTFMCISLSYVFTEVVRSARLSVTTSSSTSILVPNPSVVLSKQLVISYSTLSI
jgi:hypothetical protein